MILKLKENKFRQYKRLTSIHNIDINKIVDLIKSLLVKKVLNILLVTNMLKKIRPLCIFLPKMSAYRGNFD